MKTNKSFAKRLKVTKNGKVLGRKPGFNHNNAKQSRTTQLSGKKAVAFPMKQSDKRRFLVNVGN